MAKPPFMSQAPRPYRRPSTKRCGKLPAAGTVSRCPAMMTEGLLALVSATIVLPNRRTVRWGRFARAASMASAIGVS